MTPTKPLPAPIVLRKYDRIHHTCAGSCVQHTRCERVRNTRIIHATDHVLMKPSAGTISPCLVPQMQHRPDCEDVKRPATCSESPLNCVLAKEKENITKKIYFNRRGTSKSTQHATETSNIHHHHYPKVFIILLSEDLTANLHNRQYTRVPYIMSRKLIKSEYCATTRTID